MGAKRKNENSKIDSIIRIFYAIFFIGFWGYRDISKYQRNICQAKFGREFNTRRRSLGIPEIPADWYITSSGNKWVDWAAKDSVIGHESKDIEIDSNCSIIYEDDEYDFKRIHGKSRDISIHFRYARGKAKDSVFFWYNNGDTTRDISGQQADSIFAAEKIKKGY